MVDARGVQHFSYANNGLKYAYRNGSSWVVQYVDLSPRVGWWNSLAVDKSFHPHISYYDETNQDLKYAYHNGTAWQIQTVDSGGSIGQYTSLALDASDHPHITYYDLTNFKLKYATYNGSAWQFQVIDDGGPFGSLAIDSGGVLHVSYIDRDAKLRYAFRIATSWTIRTNLDPGARQFWKTSTSLAVDQFSTPHIAYRDDNAGALKYVYFDGAAWQPEVVDTPSGEYSAIALGAAGPHILYTRALAAPTLRHARRAVNKTWVLETLEEGAKAGEINSLALDSAGHPHIAYTKWFSSSKSFLRYAFHDGVAWQFTTVDSVGNVGQNPSLALTKTGEPCIAYSDQTNWRIKYASRSGGVWQTQVVSPDPNYADYPSLAIDGDDTPHIAYIGFGPVLRYAVRIGGMWAAEVVGGTSHPAYPSLALNAAGEPHISYYESYAGDLGYATRISSAWQVTTIESTGDVGGWNAVKVDSAGRPHIAYQNQTNCDLKYAYHNGTSWQIQKVAGDPDCVGGDLSLALDAAARPHISYYDKTHGDLMYTHFDGSAWRFETVDVHPGSYTSLALDSAGLPYISYYDPIDYDLMFAAPALLRKIHLPLILR